MKENAIEEWNIEVIASVPGLVVVLIAASVSVFISVFALQIGTCLHVLDIPDGKRKIHPTITPQIGGLAIGLPTLAISIYHAATSLFLPFYSTVVGTGLACLLLGLFDDRKPIRPIYRLLFTFLLALVALEFVPALQVTFLRFSFIDKVLFLEHFSIFFTAVCIVGLQNAVNMADGKNGIVIALCLFWCLDLFIFAPDHLHLVLLTLVVALAVALTFNLRGYLFLGDSGSYSLGFIIAILVIYIYDIAFAALHAELVVLWFLIPVVDCLRVMAFRIIRGQSPFSSDQNHLHHILNRILPWRWGLLLYLSLAGMPGLFASFFPSTALALSVVTMTCYIFIIVRHDWLVRETGSAVD